MPLAWLNPGNYFTGNHEMDLLRVELVELQALCNEGHADTHVHWDLLFSSARLEEIDKHFHEENKHCYRGICARRKQDGLIVVVSAGTREGDVDRLFKKKGNFKADFKFGLRGEFPRSYCESGKSFFDYVVSNKLGGKMPDLIIGHSLGTVFNMWINGVVGGSIYTLNIDSPDGIRYAHQAAWVQFQGVKPIHENNIDTILGSKNWINKDRSRKCLHVEGHMPSINHVGQIFRTRSGDYSNGACERHAVKNILKSIQHEFDLHYTRQFDDRYIRKHIDDKKDQEKILGVRAQFKATHGGTLLNTQYAELYPDIKMICLFAVVQQPGILAPDEECYGRKGEWPRRF